MGASKERALSGAASALKRAENKVEHHDLDRPNDPLALRREASTLTAFMTVERLKGPQNRWVPTRSVFPAKNSTLRDEQVRSTAKDLIKTANTSGAEALPALDANFHLGSEWGGEIFGVSDARALAAYAAIGFPFVPVTVSSTHHFIDASLSVVFPGVTAPTTRLRRASVRVAQNMGLKSRETFPFAKTRQEHVTDSLWRIHDCLRDFLLEGELIRDDAAKRFTASIKATSLFPWLIDDRLDIIGEAFTVAYPNQARHGKVPSTPKGEEWTRGRTLPPSISSEG